jgi:hypothetical protein
MLKGNVQAQDYLNPGKAPSLTGRDLKRAQDDAFGKGESSLPPVGEAFQPPANAFDFSASKNGPPAGDLKASVPGLDETAIAAQTPTAPFNLSAQDQDTSAQIDKDVDNSPALQLAWDQWHKRVAQAIYEKFNSMAQLAFRFSSPLSCYVTYTITSDGRVVNAKLEQKSANVAFNALVLMVVSSMSGQTDILAFPQGSQRGFVNKAGMFTQNYGVQGFRYTTGDKETVPGH